MTAAVAPTASRGRSSNARALLSVARIVSPVEPHPMATTPKTAGVLVRMPPRLKAQRHLRVVARRPARALPDGVALLDLLAIQIAQLQARYREDVDAMEKRQRAVELGTKRSIDCGDTVAATVAGFETELRTFEKRLIMSESALESIYNLLDTLATGVAQAQGARSCTA